MLVSKQSPTIMLNQSKLDKKTQNPDIDENSQRLVNTIGNNEKYQGLNIDDNNNTQRNKSNISAEENESGDLENNVKQVLCNGKRETKQIIRTNFKCIHFLLFFPLIQIKKVWTHA